MTTVARLRFDLEIGTRPRTGVLIDGVAPYVLTGALALVVLLAAGGSLLFRDVLRGPEAMIGSLQGTALVLLVVTLPVLIASAILVRRGSAVAMVGWLGALGSIAYEAMLLLFLTPFNAFFFLYVGLLSLSIWSLIAIAASTRLEDLGEVVGQQAPVPLVAGYLAINALLFGLLWLQMTIPGLLEPFPRGSWRAQEL
jgi:hypothetical protein